MLSKPEQGWTEFSLGGVEADLSYLTNVPIEWLDQAIHGLTTLQPFTVCGLLEPGRMLCLVGYWNCYVIFEEEEKVNSTKENTRYEIVNVNMIDFCKKLHHDVSNNIEAWCNWDFSSVIELEVMKQKLDKLENLIKEKEPRFECKDGQVIFFD